VNNHNSAFILFDLVKDSAAGTAPNPSGQKTFLGGHPLKGLPIAIVRDVLNLSVYNAETNRIGRQSIYSSNMTGIESQAAQRLANFWVEYNGKEIVHIYLLEYKALERTSVILKITRSVRELLEIT
jgi:hypothetical protein